MATTVSAPPPGYKFQRYGPNESVPTATDSTTESPASPRARPGDFVLTHGSGVFAFLIKIGQRCVYWGKKKIYADWTHAAIFVDDNGFIIEAVGGGVQKRNISHYRGTEYIVGHLPETTSDAARQQAVRFANHCLHQKYGLLTIVSIGVCLYTGSNVHFGVNGQQICSGLVARCIERIGEIFTENEPWQMMPADLAKHFDLRPTKDRGKPPKPNEGVKASSKPGRGYRETDGGTTA